MGEVGEAFKNQSNHCQLQAGRPCDCLGVVGQGEVVGKVKTKGFEVFPKQLLLDAIVCVLVYSFLSFC